MMILPIVTLPEERRLCSDCVTVSTSVPTSARRSSIHCVANVVDCEALRMR
ncbi:hypothetical protein D3C80_693770 [compost metagenome]